MLHANETQLCRVTRSKEAARTSYNRLSHWYDLVSGPSEQKTTHKGLRILSAKLGETILEIGFGTGHSLLALAESVGEAGRTHGIDLSEGMLAIAQKRIARAGLLKTVKLRYGDAVGLPYRGDRFNAVFSSFTLELFDTPEIPIVLKECQRVLKNQGRICIVYLSRSGKPNSMLRWYG